MKIESVRRVIETASFETANQYLRFGWKLLNQHVVEGTTGEPLRMNYVLASVRTLEDTRRLLELTDWTDVNRYLELGWKLIDQYVSGAEEPQRRQETVRFVLAWQDEAEPLQPSDKSPSQRADELFPDDQLQALDEQLPEHFLEGPGP